ncbi:hypothetical protein DEAC_c40540 [Desulfosporosinus acididurans]|uniref:Uncharacterized protein n=1 Tax=Desulfosporosinus acididurans TaxID=476652 RepID=A0A0J1FKQ5_9FIRM|nr:hypothetical protein [Desulfosporosinus acididurans]KLU64060.1 hypothetical protein DEAC_c40540 [Desulfosporosinus acididurans]
MASFPSPIQTQTFTSSKQQRPGQIPFQGTAPKPAASSLIKSEVSAKQENVKPFPSLQQNSHRVEEQPSSSVSKTSDLWQQQAGILLKQYGPSLMKQYGPPLARKIGLPLLQNFGPPLAKNVGIPLAQRLGSPFVRRLVIPLAKKAGFAVIRRLGFPF